MNEIKGTVFQVLAPQKGIAKQTGKEWQKQGIVIDTESDFEEKLCVEFFNSPDALTGIEKGDKVTIGYYVSSREYNGRWYADVKGKTISKVGGNARTEPQMDTPSQQEDDLPF